MNKIALLIGYENGELNAAQTIELFSMLIKSGEAFKLQGAYGRMATLLVNRGFISKTGKILKGETVNA